MKIAVVTSSIGANGLLPIKKFPGVDYHAFVDGVKNTHEWIAHPVVKFSSDPTFKNRRDAKVYKILPFAFLPDYDYYFWVDSTHVLSANPVEVIEKYLNDSDVAVFKHSNQNCVYDEGNAVISLGYDHPNLVEDQLAFYRDMCYPAKNGLYELPARLQRNTHLTQRMGLMWWEQICMFSSRDQISFPFVCHQLGITPSILPGNANGIGANSIMPQVVASGHNRRF